MTIFGALRRPLFLGTAVLTAATALTAAPAMAHVSVGVGFGYSPGYCCGGPYYNPYYYPPPPPPVYYAPPPPPAMVVQPVQPQPPQNCQQGQWKQPDGSMVSGTACQQPDGSWRLSQ